MDSWKTAGHDHIKAVLDKQLATGRFSHAYLFTGPQGLGKTTLALEFSKKLLRTDRLDTCADFQMITEEQFSAEDIARFAASLRLKPFSGTMKVAIVKNAHLLTVHGTNALLKTMEEPPPGTCIILTSDTKQLLPTVVSRCQSFCFYPFSRQELQTFAEAAGIQADSEMLRLSFGRPARLCAFSRDAALYEGERSAVQFFDRIRSMRAAERLLAIPELADLEVPLLRRRFETWLLYGVEQKNGAAVAARLLQAYADLATNKSKKFILQNLFLNMN